MTIESWHEIFLKAEAKVIEAQTALRNRTSDLHLVESCFVDASLESGLTEYGPITSELRLDERSGEVRRVWLTRGEDRSCHGGC